MAEQSIVDLQRELFMFGSFPIISVLPFSFSDFERRGLRWYSTQLKGDY